MNKILGESKILKIYYILIVDLRTRMIQFRIIQVEILPINFCIQLFIDIRSIGFTLQANAVLN